MDLQQSGPLDPRENAWAPHADQTATTRTRVSYSGGTSARTFELTLTLDSEYQTQTAWQVTEDSGVDMSRIGSRQVSPQTSNYHTVRGGATILSNMEYESIHGKSSVQSRQLSFLITLGDEDMGDMFHVDIFIDKVSAQCNNRQKRMHAGTTQLFALLDVRVLSF